MAQVAWFMMTELPDSEALLIEMCATKMTCTLSKSKHRMVHYGVVTVTLILTLQVLVWQTADLLTFLK